MKNFKDFDITPVSQGLIGDKIPMYKVLNREITVVDYRLGESKFKDKGNGQCLSLQIELSGQTFVVFTGSGILMNAINQITKDNLPFTTTIVQEDKRLLFT